MLILQGILMFSQIALPQSFGASHGPRQPQYFFIIILGRRKHYVHVDFGVHVSLLSPYQTNVCLSFLLKVHIEVSFITLCCDLI